MKKIKSFRSEVESGLEDLVGSNAVIAYSSLALPSKVEEENRAVVETLLASSVENKDLYYLDSILVSTGWNKNDDVFDRYETWAARNTPENKQFNFMHNENDIIGHITGNYVLDSAGKILADETNIDSVPDRFDIVTNSVIYTSWSDPEKRERISALIREIEEKKWYVSMECCFAGFDYAVIYNNGEEKIITRSEQSAFLTKHLRAYGGGGEYEGYKLGRLLRDISFSGKGLVNNPANPKSIILNSGNSFKQTKAIKIEQTDIRENRRMSDNDNALLRKVEKLEADLAEAKTNEKQMAEEIQIKAEKEFSSKISAFEAEVSSLTEAVEVANQAATEKGESLSGLQEQLETIQTELAEAKTQIQEHKDASKSLARKSALVDAGIVGEDSDAIVSKFADATDEMFDEVVKLAFTPTTVEEEIVAEADEDTSEEEDEAEAVADEEVLEEAEEVSEAALVDAGETDEVETARAGMADWLQSNVLRTTQGIEG